MIMLYATGKRTTTHGGQSITTIINILNITVTVVPHDAKASLQITLVGPFVSWSPTLSDFHSFGVSGPLQSVVDQYLIEEGAYWAQTYLKLNQPYRQGTLQPVELLHPIAQTSAPNKILSCV